jgi:hypothetical protein
MTRAATPSCELLVVGGIAKSDAARLPEWRGYRSGLIMIARPAEDMADAAATYQSPRQLCPDSDPSFIFKAASRVGDKLYVCTQTEILIYGLPDFNIVHHLSHPWFNDLHHVLPLDEERLLVAVTGLDMVLELGLNGHVLRHWDVLGEPPFSRFSRLLDYRKIATRKPHAAHPNHVFVIGDDIWVTRFIQRDAICLTDRTKRIEIGLGGPHDGVVVDQRVYFTTVEGHVVIADPNGVARSEAFDLNQITQSTTPLGWCRGIKSIGERRVVVGFSRLRPTKWQMGVGVLKSSIKASRMRLPGPTRLACYDLAEKQLIWEFNLEKYGMNAVFSIV